MPVRRVLIVCSSGVHLAELYRLDAWWRRHERVWVTFDAPDAASVLHGERAVLRSTQASRNAGKNTLLALKILYRERPELIVSSGAGMALPFLWLGKGFFGCRTITFDAPPSRPARCVSPEPAQVLAAEFDDLCEQVLAGPPGA